MYISDRFQEAGRRRGLVDRGARGENSQKTQQLAQKRIRAHNATPHVARYHYAG